MVERAGAAVQNDECKGAAGEFLDDCRWRGNSAAPASRCAIVCVAEFIGVFQLSLKNVCCGHASYIQRLLYR